MSRKLSIYNKLVNEVPGIREKYITYKQTDKSSALKAYAYLGLMNFRYHVLCNKSVGELSLGKSDEDISICPHFTESALVDYGTASEFADRLMKYDVISFDVFDTLIFRPFKKPTDLFYFLEKEYTYPQLKKLRTDAEKNVRINKNKLCGHGEVSFKEIWEELEAVSGLDASSGMKKELELELKYCFANPFFKEVINILRAQNKKLIICSDMYLGKEYIKKLLDNCGFEGFTDYVVSSDYERSKASGELYNILKEKYGNNIVHIGDNAHSDIKMAEKSGIKSVYYANVNAMGNKYRPTDMSPVTASIYGGLINSCLYNGLNRQDWEYEFGFVYGGLLVAGYCRFIHEYARNNDVDKLLFLSRDGDVINKAYKLMYPEEINKCEYVLWSRLAATKLCAADYKALFMERMIDHKINAGYNVADVFNTMDLLSLADILVKENPEISLTDALDKNKAEIIKAFLSEHWDEVTDSYYGEKKEALNYYQNILSGCKKALAIDSGWMGSGALMLNQLLKESACKITGVLLGTLSAHSIERDAVDSLLSGQKLVSYCFSSQHNRDFWKMHDAAKGHNLVVELLLSSDKPSFRGFKKNAQGEYSFNNTSEKIDSIKVQEGILDFVKLFIKYVDEDITISGRDAFYPVTVLYRNRKWMDALIKETGININIE